MDSSFRKRFPDSWPSVLTRVLRGTGRWAARNPVLLLCAFGFSLSFLSGRPETQQAVWLTALTVMPMALVYELLTLPGWEGVRAGCARLLRRLRGRVLSRRNRPPRD